MVQWRLFSIGSVRYKVCFCVANSGRAQLQARLPEATTTTRPTRPGATTHKQGEGEGEGGPALYNSNISTPWGGLLFQVVRVKTQHPLSRNTLIAFLCVCVCVCAVTDVMTASGTLVVITGQTTIQGFERSSA